MKKFYLLFENYNFVDGLDMYTNILLICKFCKIILHQNNVKIFKQSVKILIIN